MSNQTFNLTGNPNAENNTWIATNLQRFDEPSAWSLGRVPTAGDNVIIEHATGDIDITQNSMPQNLNSFNIGAAYTGKIYFNSLFAEGSWGSYGPIGSQYWNVNNNIVLNGGVMHVYGSFVGNSTDSPGYNLTAEGEGQQWRSLNGDIIGRRRVFQRQ
ncbi:MAG: hypothetical protein IIC81_05625 [Chloroflexi bacterium]|nr:hypothetical protein [Chloroflexota bacterium]